MFARAHRLRRSHDILTVLRRGMRRSHGPFTCYYNRSASPARATVIVDKKVSKLAVERNKVRRRIRAALKEIGLPQSGDLIIRANKESLTLPYQEVVRSIRQCLRVASS